MKKNIFLLILILVCLTSACAFSAEQDKNQLEGKLDTIESSEQDVHAQDNLESTNESEKVCLELVNFQDRSPYYAMSFHKINEETGKLLSFEGNVEPEDQTIAGPENFSINPSKSLVGLSYGFDGKENLADTIILGFWNRGEEPSVVVTIDGLDYELTFPVVSTKSVTASEYISFDEFRTKIEEFVIYPNALLIKMPDVDKEEWGRIFLIEAPEQSTEVIAPRGSWYDEESKVFELLYTFDHGVPESNLVLKIKRDHSSEENPYFDYLLNLT